VQQVIMLVRCPNCGRKLTELPKNYPLYDIQCTGCSFRAQAKSRRGAPEKRIRRAGWEVMEKVLKAGFMIPPLIVNFQWIQRGIRKQRIVFYPFIPKKHLRRRQLSDAARRAHYRMFDYVDLDELPHYVLISK